MQHTSLSPDGKLLVIVGDNPEGMLVDSQTGKVGFFCLSILHPGSIYFPKDSSD